jgi:hypothetical protein
MSIILLLIIIIIKQEMNYYPAYAAHPAEVLVFSLSLLSNIYPTTTPVTWITLNVVPCALEGSKYTHCLPNNDYV